jgi:hypothetical protein
MRTELISIPTPTHPLDAAYYTPDGPSKGALMCCHGNQMNFYVCAARLLAPHLTALGLRFHAVQVTDWLQKTCADQSSRI